MSNSRLLQSLISAPAEAQRDFYGAIIHEAKLGPRHELSLRIETWREGKHTFGGGVVVNLRFGAIYNFEEVKEFFVNLPTDGLHYLRELSESRAGRRIIEMEFDRTEARVRVIARKVSMTTSKGVTSDCLSVYCHQCQYDVIWPASLSNADRHRLAEFVRSDTSQAAEGVRFAKERLGMEIKTAKGLVHHITRQKGKCHRCKCPLEGEVSTCANCHSANLDW